MNDLFETGQIIDWIVGLTILEVAALLLYQRIVRVRLASADILSSIAAGVFLLVALRNALVGVSWSWIALCLVAALLAHAFSLWCRLRMG